MKPSNPTRARRRRAAPLPPAEGEIAALDHARPACKPATQRSRRARERVRQGVAAVVPLQVTEAQVRFLYEVGYLDYEDMGDKVAIARAVARYWTRQFEPEISNNALPPRFCRPRK